MIIEPITHEEVGRYAKAFRKLGMVPVNRNTAYYGIRDDTGKLLSIHGLCVVGKKLTIRGSYTVPEHRGRGLFIRLLEWGMEEAKRQGAEYCEATVTPAALPAYLRRGARTIKQYRACRKVRIDL
jgi:GNAT superfamily N-acetyltransferase